MSQSTPEFLQLQEAAAAGDLEQVRSLLDAGTDQNADFGAPRGWSPLMSAAYYGHLEVVQLLVERGARLDAVEVDRWGTALDIAQDAGQTEIVAYLKRKRTPTGDKVPNPYRKGKLNRWHSPSES